VERLGMQDGVIALEYNPRLEAQIPADVRARIDKARADIVAGRLQVPTAEF